MIVKVKEENSEYIGWHDCKSACITKDKESGGLLLICSYLDGTDAAFPLSTMSRVYFMNDEGRTIDQDHRMCSVN